MDNSCDYDEDLDLLLGLWYIGWLKDETILDNFGIETYQKDKYDSINNMDLKL